MFPDAAKLYMAPISDSRCYDERFHFYVSHEFCYQFCWKLFQALSILRCFRVNMLMNCSVLTQINLENGC